MHLDSGSQKWYLMVLPSKLITCRYTCTPQPTLKQGPKDGAQREDRQTAGCTGHVDPIFNSPQTVAEYREFPLVSGKFSVGELL